MKQRTGLTSRLPTDGCSEDRALASSNFLLLLRGSLWAHISRSSLTRTSLARARADDASPSDPGSLALCNTLPVFAESLGRSSSCGHCRRGDCDSGGELALNLARLLRALDAGDRCNGHQDVSSDGRATKAARPFPLRPGLPSSSSSPCCFSEPASAPASGASAPVESLPSISTALPPPNCISAEAVGRSFGRSDAAGGASSVSGRHALRVPVISPLTNPRTNPPAAADLRRRPPTRSSPLPLPPLAPGSSFISLASLGRPPHVEAPLGPPRGALPPPMSAVSGLAVELAAVA